LTKDEALYKGLIRDYTKAPLTASDSAMLTYSAKLTLTPGRMVPQDVETLREHGFSDAAIGDIAMHVSFFCVMNRMVDGLGADVSDEVIQEAEDLGMTIPLHLIQQNS
jgi:uncharacterized peroxidase-related enzyme